MLRAKGVTVGRLRATPLVMSFSASTRAASLARMAEDRFDVLVIGGGITGAGIALDAAARGFSVALAEKRDFASGTSGRSSRLVHGGLRYLEHGEVRLVHECLRERRILRRLAPHLVRPVPMYLLAESPSARTLYRAGLTSYDLLAAGRNIGVHHRVSAEHIRAVVPGFGGQHGGFRYFECQTDDARLTVEVARTAQSLGAVLANYAEVTSFLGGAAVERATVTDKLTGERLEVRASVTVNATGVWADQVRGLAAGGVSRLRPSKGVHLVFAPGTIEASAAFVIPSAAGDRRSVFLVPWEDRVYAGTTDTPYDGDLDDPPVEQADRDYILAAVAQYFPAVAERDVIASWAGLRPLLSHGTSDPAATEDLSRRHATVAELPGLFTITGGKLTTYRAMAEDVVDRIAAVLGPRGRCRTRDIPIGLHGSAEDALALARREATKLGLTPASGERLALRYGDDWREAIRMIATEPGLGEPVADGLPVLKVEVELARTREMAITDEDVFARRTRLTTRDSSVRLPAS
jgi:glycerol-3-phosphate dehydrogenase